MNYEIGHKYPFVLVRCERLDFNPDKYRATDRSGFFTPTFLPWEHELRGIEVFNLTCIEHPDSKGEFSGDVTPKGGAIFLCDRDVQGVTRWGHNYPTIHEGYSSRVSANLLVSEFAAEQGLPKEWLTEFVRQEHPYMVRDVRYYIKEAMRGVYELWKQNEHAKVALLEQHIEQVRDLITKETGLYFLIKPHMFERGQENLDRAAEMEAQIMGAMANPVRPTEGDLRELAKKFKVDIPLDYPEAAYTPSCQLEQWLPGWYDVELVEHEVAEDAA